MCAEDLFGSPTNHFQSVKFHWCEIQIKYQVLKNKLKNLQLTSDTSKDKGKSVNL